MPKWFQTDVARYEDERTRMERRGFVIDQAAREQRNRVEFTGLINDGVSDVAIRVICEDGFPYRIPLFLALDLQLTPATRHIAFRTGMICLRTAKPQGWNSDEHIVDLITDAERILRAQHSGDFGEEHVAPDQDLFGTRAAEKHVLIPDDLLTPPDTSWFQLDAWARFSEKLLTAHRIGPARTEARLTPSLKEVKLPVFRLTAMPLDTISECNDLISAPNPNWEDMLKKYAVNPGTAVSRMREIGLSTRGGYIGIVFPYQDGWFWQFFELRRVSKKQFSIMRLATAKLSALAARISGVLDIERLQKQKVMITGVGAIGGTAAVELACAGVGKLFLNDGDVVSVANVVRHECSLATLGAKKTEAVSTKIKSKNLLTTVVSGQEIFSDPQFEQKVIESDLVICAIGDYNIEGYVNQVCVRNRKPAIFAYVGVYGAMGHVFRMNTAERETGCFACFRQYLGGGQIPDLPALEDPNVAVVEMGCNNPSLPAPSFDQRQVALIAVRKAIQALDPWTYSDDNADAIVFYSRHMTGIVNEQSLRTKKFVVPPLEDCPICGAAAHR